MEFIKDLTHNGKEITTVLRSVSNSKFWIVVQGKTITGVFLDNYKEFSDFNQAYDYFMLIKEK